MPEAETVDSRWKSLYRIGGAAPLVTLALYLSQIFIFIFGGTYPSTIEGWFSLFQRNRLLGLFYLNALDILSIALLGLMFLALYIALRRTDESHMAVAAFFACLGIPVFIVPRVALLSIVPLSGQYAAASTEAQRSQILAAGQAISALGWPTLQTTGFLFLAVAVLIISGVMLRGNIFGKVTAYTGILASVVTLADAICVFSVPALAGFLLGLGGGLWILWWVLIARRLLQLGRPERKALPLKA
jgi:hypothetical protein